MAFLAGFIIGGLGVAFAAFCFWLNSAPCDDDTSDDEHAEHPGV